MRRILLAWGVLGLLCLPSSAQSITRLKKTPAALQQQAQAILKKRALRIIPGKWYRLDLKQNGTFYLFTYRKSSQIHGFALFKASVDKSGKSGKTTYTLTLQEKDLPLALQGDEITVLFLHEERPEEGFAITNANNLHLYLSVFSGNGSRYLAKADYQGSEFSTTGWTTVGTGRAENGYLAVIETSESPGEETEEGRKMETSIAATHVWTPSKKAFIHEQPNP